MALILTAEQMRAADRAAIEGLGVPGLVLMENAGRGVADVIARARPALQALPVVVVCGAGQNGGDGFVIARHLANRGARVKVLLTAPRARITGDAAVYLATIAAMKTIPIEDLASEEDSARWAVPLQGAAVLVDAIFGTGLRSDITGAPAAAVAAMNASPALRVAVDIPSGLDADRGVVRGAAVKADITATMGAFKLGLLVDAAAPVGQIEVVDLGVSVEAIVAGLGLGPLCHLLDDPLVRARLPRQAATGYKGTRGHVLLIAGSPGKTGAAMLAGRAALRAGVGLCTVASTREGQAALDAKALEVMTACYADGADADEQSFDRIKTLAGPMKAVGLGPGIPTGPGQKALVRRLAAELPLPLVIDADGLTLLGTDAPAALASAPAPRVLTPHPGEMGRLTGLATGAVQSDRMGVVRRLAATTKAVVVLKGARTLIASPDGTVYLNPTADPALGTAGSGDVLTGVVSGLLAQGLSALDAALVGVFAHGRAADEARRALGSRLLIAGDLPEAVARSLEKLLAVGDGERS